MRVRPALQCQNELPVSMLRDQAFFFDFFQNSGMKTDSSDLAALINQAREGNSDALGDLLERYRHFISLLVRARFRGGRLQARVDSSDIVQDVLLRVSRHISTFEGSDQPAWEGWLRRIAEREVIRQFEHHRGAARRDIGREQPRGAATDDAPSQLLAGWLEASITSPSLAMVRKEHAILISDAIRRLPEDYREVLILRHLEERPFAEIAERLDRSTGAVRILWVRALRQLRTAIEQEIEISLLQQQP